MYAIVLILVIGLICIIGIILTGSFTKRRRQESVIELSTVSPKSNVETHIKRCPTCHNTYTDETLKYCLVDGASLEYAPGSAASSDPEATIRINRKGATRVAPTIQYQPDTPTDNDKV